MRQTPITKHNNFQASTAARQQNLKNYSQSVNNIRRPPVADQHNFPKLPTFRQQNWWLNPCNSEANQQTASASYSKKDELFSITEISKIVQEVIGRFERCHSKSEQLQVIFEISAKYCNGNNK